MYPDDSIQAIIQPSDWWLKKSRPQLCRGSLIYAFVPHVDQVPYTFDPVGRHQPHEHTTAEVRIAPLRITKARRTTNLPVAAMPLHSGEVWTTYRAKKRPCLVIACDNPIVERTLVRGMPKRSSAPTVLAAPYYGADKGGKRSGYNPVFVERIRHCEYPQFVWDSLPISGPDESILRLDHIQPIGTNHNSYELSGFELSADAIEVVDEHIRWLIWGGVLEDSLIALYRDEIESTFDQ